MKRTIAEPALFLLMAEIPISPPDEEVRQKNRLAIDSIPNSLGLILAISLLTVIWLTGCAGPQVKVSQETYQPPSKPSLAITVQAPKSPPPSFSKEYYTVNGKRYYILTTARGYEEQGQAIWYGRGHHGRRTSSGEKMNMYAMTAAHRTLPFNSWIKVTNMSNSKSVVVRINDRGPFVETYLIDLTYKAAQALDMLNTGTTQVRLESVEVEAGPVPHEVVVGQQGR